MCGVLAIGGGLPEVAEKRIRHALPLIAHRGLPGRNKIMVNSGGAVGHVRLPIVGLDTSFDQPVRRIASGTEWLIAFVGEVLDFKDKRPKSQCDLEVVTQGWLRDGPKSLVNHDGFWGVVALSDKGDLHFFCDYLAQKPMYYRVDVGAVCSELDAIASLAGVTPDEVYFSAVAKWGYCPDLTRTPYNEVKHVLPGEHIVLNSRGQARRRITDPLHPVSCTPEELKREIDLAVKRRVLSADVPVACLVSGGLDSSIVYMLARRYGTVKPYYVYDPAHQDNNEAWAVSAASWGDKVTAATWGNVNQQEALRIMQEPIDLGSLLPQVALSRIVEERVCLTGDGADEAFGGYGRSDRYDSQMSDLFHELPAWHLPRLDRVMMRECIEVRSPFLSRRVVQMAMSLPHVLRQDKIILRDLFKNDLPTSLAYRPKKPLRTSDIERDREGTSKNLVSMFRRMKWPEKLRAVV